MDESERIKRVYAQRERDGLEARYTLFNDASLYAIQRRERDILRTLKGAGFTSLSDKRILDVGCGDGGGLRRLLAYGASPRNLWGIDLLSERILVAKDTHPLMRVLMGNAVALPFATRSFDLVMQFTVLSSILDRQVKRQVANEMLRVLKPNGMILWYDFWAPNPRNSNVRGIRRQEIEALFPGCVFNFRRTTLAPPLTRALVRYSWLACYLVEKVPFVRTHYLATIRMNHAAS